MSTLVLRALDTHAPFPFSELLRTFPVRFDTGQDSGSGSGSRVGGADRAATPSGALYAGTGALDDEPGAEGTGPHPGDVVSPDSTTRPMRALVCPRCTSCHVADLGGWAECCECGHGFPI